MYNSNWRECKGGGSFSYYCAFLNNIQYIILWTITLASLHHALLSIFLWLHVKNDNILRLIHIHLMFAYLVCVSFLLSEICVCRGSPEDTMQTALCCSLLSGNCSSPPGEDAFHYNVTAAFSVMISDGPVYIIY